MSNYPTKVAPQGILGSRFDRTWPILLEIQRALEPLHEDGSASPTLAGGLGGSILFHRYLFEVTSDPHHERVAEQQLDRVLDQAGRLPLAALFGGAVGAAWLLAHLSRLDGDEPDVEEIDDVLEAVLDQPWRGPYDVVSGIAGIGLYAVERLPYRQGRLLLERVVEHLDELSITTAEGYRTWFTPPCQIPASQIEAYPEGYYNLGLAHGVPGCLKVLVEAVRSDVCADRALMMVEETVAWIFSHLRECNGRWCLPPYVATSDGSSERPLHTRLAWCYNELGAMVPVLAAARVAGRVGWHEQALEAVRSTQNLSLEKSGCVDASLCHGTAGIAHIYHRLGRDLNDECLLSEARRWFDHTIELHAQGTGCGGYFYHNASPTPYDPERSPRPGFLEGSAGIALALLSATFGADPGWDRMLALS